MRTTVTLEPDVESLIRENVRRTRRPFKRVLNEAIRRGLRDAAAGGEVAPFRVEARPLGLLAGRDPQALGKLADDLEAEAFLEVTRRLESRGA